MKVKEKYMRRALQIAKMGSGATSPNPMVGAVIVCDGKIIGEGYHRCYGTAHAEVNAIRSVKNPELFPRCTMYVTLEPCSHYGKTPPCCDLIINKKIPRVVIGCKDPFERVSGRGIAKLREAGVEVEVGILEDECREIDVKFMTAHTKQRPFILLKWAQSKDGFMDKIRDKRGGQALISTPITSMWTHRERALHDAIMVGSQTVVLDNPSLNVRNWNGRNPLRVVIDTKAVIPLDSKVITDGEPTIIFTSSTILKDYAEKVKEHPEVTCVGIDVQGHILNQIFSELYEKNVSSIMVEGGSKLLNVLIQEGLWDSVRYETGTMDLCDGVPAPTMQEKFIKKINHGQNEIRFFDKR